jgi:hypothetical protein
MHPGSPPGEEASDARVVARRGEQLDPAGTDREHRGLDALLVEQLAKLDLGPEQAR